MVAIPLCTLPFVYYRGLVLEYSLLKLKDFFPSFLVNIFLYQYSFIFCVIL